MRKAFKWRLSIARNKQVHWLDDWGMWLPLYDFKCWKSSRKFLRSFFFTEQLFLASFINWNWAFSKRQHIKTSGNHILCCDWRESWRKLLKTFFFPFFLLVNYCKSFFNDFFIFLLTIGDFLSWAALQIPFLPSSPPPSSSISPTAMRDRKIASRQQFFCVLFQFFSYFFFFFDTIPSPSIPFSHIIILYSVPFCPFI